MASSSVAAASAAANTGADGDEATELARVALLPVVYHDLTKGQLRYRTNLLLDRHGLSKAKFAKMLHFQRTRISMVLHNTYQSEATLVYARFAQFLYASDARLMWCVAAALEGAATFEQTAFEKLHGAPSAAEIAAMNPTQRAKAYSECLRNKANAPIVDRLAKALLAAMATHPATACATFPAVSTVRGYISCNLSLPARTDADQHVLLWLDTIPPPTSAGWLYKQHLGIDGDEREAVLPAKPRGAKRPRPSEDDERDGSSDGEDDDDDDVSDSDSSASGPSRYSRSYVAPADSKRRRSAPTDPMKQSFAAAASSKSSKGSVRSSKKHTESSDDERSSGRSSDDGDDDEGADSDGAETTTSKHSSASRRRHSSSTPSRTKVSKSAERSIADTIMRLDARRLAQIPACYLRPAMPAFLKRLAAVLERDAISRRRVAVEIGVSQSKMSRAILGRAPFRGAEAEARLRYWMYLRDRKWVQRLESFMRRATSRDNIVDFASLPAPLQAIQPPQNLILYLHFLLDLDRRGSIDALVAEALGLEANRFEAARDDGEDDARDVSPEPLASVKGESVASEVYEETVGPSSLLAPHVMGKRELPTPTDEVVSPTPVPPLTLQVNGLDAWSTVSHDIAQKRLADLAVHTNTTQVTIAKYIESNSATVSMLLRGVYHFVSLDALMAKLRQFGRTADRLIVAKVLSILGVEDASNDSSLASAMATPVPATRQYAQLLGYADELTLNIETEQLRAKGALSPLVAMKELTTLLTLHRISLEVNDPLVPDLPGVVAPLSLASWLQHACNFLDRGRIDRLVVPWADRWATSSDLPLTRDFVASCQKWEGFLRQHGEGLAEPSLPRELLMPSAPACEPLPAMAPFGLHALPSTDSVRSMHLSEPSMLAKSSMQRLNSVESVASSAAFRFEAAPTLVRSGRR